MFRGVSFRLLHDPPLESIRTHLQCLRGDQADAIAVIPHHYIYVPHGSASIAHPPPEFHTTALIFPDTGQDPEHPNHNTPAIATVRATCREAIAQGFRVMLKPHIDAYNAAWRGWVSVQHLAAEWEQSYKDDFLAPYVDLAKELAIPLLCIGCELYTVTKELVSNGVRPNFWIDMAQWVRARGYTGQLTYAANWGTGDDAEFRRLEGLWPHLDYIGVDAYWPLVQPDFPGEPDLPALVAGWHRDPGSGFRPPVDDLLQISSATHKPLLFTEIGYPNHRRAAVDPEGGQLTTLDPDEALQLRLFDTFKQVWGGVNTVAGYFWWDAWLLQDPSQTSIHDIFDKKIEPVLFRTMPPGVQAFSTDPIPKHGVQGPERPFSDVGAAWGRLAGTRASWIRLFHPQHTADDAKRARDLGMRVLIRAPGGAAVDPQDVLRIIQEFWSLCQVIEVGEQPLSDPRFSDRGTLLQAHAVALENVLNTCDQEAFDARIALCTPGWAIADAPPNATWPDSALGARLHTLYGEYNAIGVQALYPDSLDFQSVYDRVNAWKINWEKPLYLTAYGLATPWLLAGNQQSRRQAVLESIEKAHRYATFLHRIQTLGYVRAAFVLGGTHGYQQRGSLPGPYDPTDADNYWLTDTAWAAFGDLF